MTADLFEVINLLARGGKATVHAPSRRPPEASGSSTCVASSEGHRLEPIVKADRATNPYCRYEHFPYGMKNKKQKCGEGSVRVQAGRSRCTFFGPHPSCGHYHADCLNKRHGWGDYGSS